MTDVEKIAQTYASEYGSDRSALYHLARDYLRTVDELQRALAPGYLRMRPLAPVKEPKPRADRVLDVDSTQAV